MKTKIAQMQVARLFSILACAALLAGAPARACTVFCDSQGGIVLAGRSFDIPSNPHLGILVVPAADGKHGWCCGGYYSELATKAFPQVFAAGPWADALNDQGLFVAVADVPADYTNITKSLQPPADLQMFYNGLMGNCASVAEAIAWCQKQPVPCLQGWVNHSDGGDYTYITGGHLLVADRSGDSVVFEWKQGRLEVIRKKGRYQLMTNFLLSDPQAGDFPCARFSTDSKILDQAAGPSLATCRQVLETTAQACTRYSLICDLTHGDIQVYLRRGFDQPKTIHLADELQKGWHELDLDQFFGRSGPESLSPPPLISPSTIPAAEILKRSLATRGGGRAAARIHSIHGKGTIELGVGYLSPSPTEFYAMRPDRFRAVTDILVPTGLHLGRYVSGFDGHTGWNTIPDSPRTVLQGEMSEQRQDEATFFGWYVDPGADAAAECLGEAQFDGKLCYELKVVSKTHHEYFEYYDTTSFLMVGMFARVTTPTGSGWAKSSFGDYRAFAGFLMPTRFTASSDDNGWHSIQINSYEINSVTEKDLQMAEKDTRLKQ